MVTIANLKGFGLHLDSREAHFQHEYRRKCMKNRSGQDGIEPPPPAFSGLSGDTRDATVR